MRSNLVLSSTVLTASLSLVLAALMGTPAAVAEEGAAGGVVAEAGPGRPDFSPFPAEPVVQEPLEPVLVPKLSTADSQTFVNPDGSYEVRQFDAPLQYEASDGSWQRIDNALVESSRSGYAVENKANAFKALLPSNPAAAPVRFELGEDWVSMRMHGLSAQPPQASRNEASYGVAPTQDGAKAPVIADEVTYEAVGNGLKETIHLEQPPAVDAVVEYEFDLNVSPGLTPVLSEDGDIDFVAERRDADGDGVADVAFSMPAGHMVDSAKEPARSTDVVSALGEAGGEAKAGWTLTVTPSVKWLTDPARVYPVAIDPSITNTATSDCFIQAAAPNDVACGDAETIVKVGHSSSSYQYRGLFAFDVSSIPTDAVINYSNLNVYIDSQYTTRAWCSRW